MRRLAALVVSLLLALGAAACGGGSTQHHGTARGPDAPATAGTLAEALALAPAGASEVTFTDRTAIADRAGVGAVGPDPSAADLERYRTAVTGLPVGGTDLAAYLAVMTDAPLDELDVDWELQVSAGPSDGYSLFRTSDALDLDHVATEMEADGYHATTVDGDTRLQADLTDPTTASSNGLIAGKYPPSWVLVTLDPTRHLVIVADAARAMRVIADPDTSLAHAGTFASLVTGSGPVEYAVLDAAPSCGAGVEPQTEATVARRAGLGTPERTSFVLRASSGGADGDTVDLAFASSSAAASDAKAREQYLASGMSAYAEVPLASFGTYDVSRSGSIVHVAITPSSPDRIYQLVARDDGPLLCTP